MKKVSILIALVILFVSCTTAQMNQVREYADKGTRVYVLISENQPLIEQIYKQIQKAEKARQAYLADTHPFTEMTFVTEVMKLYHLNIAARELLKELNRALKNE